MANKIDAKMLSKMFLAGAKNLEANKEYINELNVFPVPDGDTGTNMTLTIMSAAKEVFALGEDPELAALCKAISGGSLRGARGNSGVILSQLLRGFTKGIKEAPVLDIKAISVGFDKAVETAYKAVMKPMEGTILTVARGAAEKAHELAEDGCDDLDTFIKTVIEHAKYVLSQTPEMLPVLKQAGVVDSGGQGLVEFFGGVYDAFLGKEIPFEEEVKQAHRKDAPKVEIKFAYATEFVIRLTRNFNIKTEMDFIDMLNSIGEEVSCVTEAETVTVKVQTNDPGIAIQKALKYGELSAVSITNLRLGEKASAPVKEAAHAEAPKVEEPQAPAVPEERKAYGFVAVSIGEGLNEIFKGLGVDYVIEGGQTMNPSTEDVLNAIDHINADTIFVLPNNKNVIMAANQAVSLVEDKKIIVIPTKTVPQGITAVINFVPDLSPEENEEIMSEEIKNVKTGEVTYAVRDTQIDDKVITQGDYMGIGDKGILTVGRDLKEITVGMVDAMVDDSVELISIYYGQDVKEEDAEEIRAAIEEAHGDCDIEMRLGGQPIYYYVISAE